MYVVGTAGHVDHGKSTLVEALTGIDPDRLTEEKVRGMTIDLGFAWLTLPSGNEVSIVDVPGHERFVNNMLAGVGGIDLALLVVAADESVMPQTREHLAILDLLNITRGLVAITKKDLVDEDWLDLVVSEVEDVLEDTVLEGAPTIAVSPVTGDGMPELVAAIDGLLTEAQPKRDLGRPRLPIDRSFTMSGFGTVVTGTLIDGSLNVGQEVELAVSGRRARVRGLQTHKTKLEEALPGTRVAANLTGVSHEEVSRGDVMATPGWLRSTTAIDLRLKVLTDVPNPLRHNMFVTVHSGSSEVIGRLRLLESSAADPGETAWAQLKLDTPVAAVKGDYVVIRSNLTTLGGGEIVDPHARRHRRKYRPLLDSLDSMQAGSAREVLLKTIEMSEPAEFQALVNKANLQPEAAINDLEQMAEERLVITVGRRAVAPGVLVYTADGWDAVSREASGFLDAYHRQYPLRKGAPREELRSRIGMTPQVFNDVLPMLADDDIVVDERNLVRAPQHRPSATKEQQVSVDQYLEMLESEPFSPPTDTPLDPELLTLLEDEDRVVRVSDSVVFTAPAYHQMVERITAYIREHGEITVADVRDMFGASRKYALPLMDHLDHERITRRVGDARVLR